jgi:hypothetical protein
MFYATAFKTLTMSTVSDLAARNILSSGDISEYYNKLCEIESRQQQKKFEKEKRKRDRELEEITKRVKIIDSSEDPSNGEKDGGDEEEVY